jgi:plastocyanin
MRLHTHIRTLALVVIPAALVLAAAACGGSSSSDNSSSPPATSSTGGSTAMASGGGASVDVALKDFSISVSGGGSMAPGQYTFHVSNDGPSAHNLTIDGPGVEDAATPTFSSGETEDLTVTLQSGSYELFCSVPGHKQAGMETKLTVS